MRNTRTFVAASAATPCSNTVRVIRPSPRAATSRRCIAATLDAALTRESHFTSMRRFDPSGVVPSCSGVDFALRHARGPRVVVDLQEKRSANHESSVPLSH